jgi:hypothetical protein
MVTMPHAVMAGSPMHAAMSDAAATEVTTLRVADEAARHVLPANHPVEAMVHAVTKAGSSAPVGDGAMGMGVAGMCVAALVVGLMALVRLLLGGGPVALLAVVPVRGGRRHSRAATLTRRL